MSVEVEKFWIFTKEGVPIVEVDITDSSNLDFSKAAVDLKVFNKFMEMIARDKKAAKKGLLTYNAGWGKYSCKFFCDDCLLFIYQSSLEVKDKNITKIAKMIISIFDDMYSKEEMMNWDGDVAKFEKLKKKLTLYFKMSNI